ncbi:MAG: hypothetical protein KF809_11410 [Chloroflexi bacterium]|nr:hypothetical protein [Chloroflexota bacterium]
MTTGTPAGRVVAAIDIGSNSIHLLVARVVDDAIAEVLLDVSTQAGIGARVDQDGSIGEVGRGAVTDAVDGYLGDAHLLGAGPIVLLGTEPLRVASDAGMLGAAIRERTGSELRVLSHEQEALLALIGVTGGRLDRELMVVDIGGGSSECILATPGEPPRTVVLPTGSSRLSSAVPTSDPLTGTDVRHLRRAAAEVAAAVPVSRPRTVVVTGGSGTNISRLLGRPRTTPVDRAALEAAIEALQARPAMELAAETGLSVRRVRQLGAGAALVEAVLDRLGANLAEVSDASLRDGAVLAVSVAGDAWMAALPRLASGPPGT